MPPGTRLAEYELLSVVGEGQFGIVYRAMDHALQRQVAIREYLPAMLASRGSGTVVTMRSEAHAQIFAQGLEAFVDEARLLARFDHPALVRVHRFWEANATGYMVMPYLEGGSVGAAREAMTHPPGEAWLRGLLLPLLDALDVLHGAGCYPREISPENIRLLPDGRPVLLDLGTVPPRIDDHAALLTAGLKAGFAPIEQYAESTLLRQGPWTNLYALAAVAYYCVSGRAPVAATARALDDPLEPLFEVVDRLGRNFPELDYSVAFVSAIERALRVRPEERPQSVAEFRRALLGGLGCAQAGRTPPRGEQAEATEPYVSFVDTDAADVGGTGRAGSAPWAQAPGAKQAMAPEGEDRGPFVSLAALEAALHADPDDHRAPPPSARGGRSALFASVAVVLLGLVGAGGWLMWSQGGDANWLSAMVPGMEPAERAAPARLPEPPASVLPEPAAQMPAPVPPGTAAEPPLPPAANAAPEPERGPEMPAQAASGSADPGSLAAAPAERPQEAASAQDEAPPDEAPADEAAADELPPDSPAVADAAPTPTPARIVTTAPDNPRVQCGSRTPFSLYRCMKWACEQPGYYGHPECRYLRATDEVKPR